MRYRHLLSLSTSLARDKRGGLGIKKKTSSTAINIPPNTVLSFEVGSGRGSLERGKGQSAGLVSKDSPPWWGDVLIIHR